MTLLDDAASYLRKVKSPDDPRIDPAAASLDLEDWGLDDNERERREAEIARRTEEKDRAEERQAKVLGEIVIEHDLVDFEGNPLPPADTREFWEAVSGELNEVITRAVIAEQGKLSPQSARR